MLSRPLPRLLILSFLFLLAASTLRGQARPAPGQLGPPIPSFGGTAYASVTVIVTDIHGQNLNEQALVKLTSDMNGTNAWGTTQERSQIIFDDVAQDNYQVEVSAAGYVSKTQNVSIMTANENYDVIVRLQRDEAGAVPDPIPGQMLAGRARKEVQKAITGLTAGNLKDAQKHLEKAHKIDPGSADIDYLMGLLYMRKNETSRAETYLKNAVAINKRHARALTMLGQLLLQQKDYQAAIGPLQQAVQYEPEFWISHWLLSEAYLKTSEFEKSRQQAELAVQKGKGAATAAELVLGEALANLGRREDAIQAFQTFLQESPQSPQAEPVRDLIAQLQRAEKPVYQEASSTGLASLPAALPAPSSPDAGLSIPTWHPPSVDDEKLTLAAGAVCPASQVIRGAAISAEKLVDNVGRFEATEQVVHQDLDPFGKPLTTAKRKFDYMASISEVKPAGLKVNESRTSLSGEGDFPDHIATRGLPALALVFHPLLRDDYDMTCEGLGEWKGRATWLVYFRQRPDKPDRFMSYNFTDAEYWVSLKGRAWISADTFQIVHLEADLLNPLPKIQLLRQHQSVDYDPVYFKSRKTQLWLPKSAEIYFDFRRHRYYRREGFENYKLFAVGASEKIGQPKIPEQTSSAPQNPQK
jgi:tetratricopeptide (TPR) repeat protein